uniref:Prefoldin subunit 5 n=1 Tax=Graphocephala atropunctata TaxID=36148 RepID=A0A1B6MUM5_9HEMI
MARPEELQAVDLSKLNIQQLVQVKMQVDQELNLLQDSMHSLKVAVNRFLDAKESLEKMTPECTGRGIMVPLTSSVYISGRIADASKVLLDIGTGFFIQRDLEGARDYFQRKVAFVKDQTEKIQAIGLEKSKIREVLVDVIETKLSQTASVSPKGKPTSRS